MRGGGDATGEDTNSKGGGDATGRTPEGGGDATGGDTNSEGGGDATGGDTNSKGGGDATGRTPEGGRLAFMNRIAETRPIWLPRLMEELMSINHVPGSRYKHLSTQEIAWTPHTKDVDEQRRHFLNCVTSVTLRGDDDEYELPAAFRRAPTTPTQAQTRTRPISTLRLAIGR